MTSSTQLVAFSLHSRSLQTGDFFSCSAALSKHHSKHHIDWIKSYKHPGYSSTHMLRLPPHPWHGNIRDLVALPRSHILIYIISTRPIRIYNVNIFSVSLVRQWPKKCLCKSVLSFVFSIADLDLYKLYVTSFISIMDQDKFMYAIFLAFSTKVILGFVSHHVSWMSISGKYTWMSAACLYKKSPIAVFALHVYALSGKNKLLLAFLASLAFIHLVLNVVRLWYWYCLNSKLVLIYLII